MRALALGLALLSATLAAAESRAVDITPAPAQVSPTWTLMVYLDGDNNLEPFAILDMQEMLQSVAPDRVNLLVLIDRAEDFDTSWDDWQGTRLYKARRGDAGSAEWQLLEDLGEQNMGDPALLERFVTSTISSYPADRYGLVMWNHGGGWSNHANDEKIPGSDGSDYLTLIELRSAIERSLAEGSIDQLDFIGFDMCLMAQLETMAELDEVADIMVASQALEPGDGWPYQSVLRLFGESDNAATVATGIVDAFDSYYRSRGEAVHTLSAFKLDETDALIDALDALVQHPQVQAAWQNVIKSIYFSESFNDLTDYKRGTTALQSWDLMSIATNLASVVPALRQTSKWRAFSDAFAASVITSRVSHHHRNSHGIAVYAPFRANLFNGEWRETRLGNSTSWSKLLEDVLNAQQNSQASVVIDEIQTFSDSRNKAVPDVIQFGQDGFLYKVRGKNNLRSLAWIGTVGRGGKVSLISKKIFSFHNDNQFERTGERERLTTVQGYSLPDGETGFFDRFDGSYLVVTDDENTVRATIDQSDIGASEQGYYLARVLYDHPEDGRYEGTLRFNWLWQADHLSLAVPQGGGTFSYISVSPKPDARLHFVLETYDAHGNLREEFGGSLLWGRGLSLTLDVLDAGDYVNLFGVEDLAGNMTFKRHDFRLSERSDQFVSSLNLKDLTVDNMAGEWEILDARAWFERSRMVSMGGKVVLEPHPDYNGVLSKTVYQGNQVISPEGLVSVLATSGLAHTRDYVLADGEPDQGWSVRAGLPVFDEFRNTSLLLGMDLSDGSVGVWRKTRGAKPVLAPAPTPTPSQPQNQAQGGSAPGGSPVEGTWSSSQGLTIVFQGNEWGMFTFGDQTDGGRFQIQGNVLMTQSQLNGAVEQYQFQLSGQVLYLQDVYGNLYEFYRNN